MDKLAEIEALRDKLNGMRPFNQGELKRMIEQFTINHTYNSNAIEGSTITLRETALIIQEGLTIAGHPIKEHLETIGYKDAFDFVMELSEKDRDLTEYDIKQIHALVLMSDRENAGVYRRLPVQISGADNTPPQPYLVPKKMEELLLSYAQSREDVFERIAKLHLEFESIHPFIDGNGRTGRLIMNLELMKNGYLPVDIKFTDRAKYYDAFADYHLTGSPNMMKDMIMNYELAELTEYAAIAEQAENADIEEWES